jgi:hypothetical protein
MNFIGLNEALSFEVTNKRVSIDKLKAKDNEREN